jgi:ribosomal protein S18 acetylase RimI-like enzyme/SAM-dependent methyltransferase
VLDIGSGTGLWAVLAARLGAKRVVAIELDPLMVGFIKGLARANGVAERVEVIVGDSRQVALDRGFDVVISETVGHLVFDESIVSIMIDARERFLKPGGALIPCGVALLASAAQLKRPALPAGLHLDYSDCESLLLHSPAAVNSRKRLSWLSEPRELVRVDLATVQAPPPLLELKAFWRAQDVTRLNAFAVSAEMEMTFGKALATTGTTSWSAAAYRVQPFQAKFGDLEFKLTLTSATHAWTATLLSEGPPETQTFSPAFAAAELIARLGGDTNEGSALPHAPPIPAPNAVARTALRLRPETPDDEAFSFHVFAGTRAEELTLTNWSDNQKEQFLRMQSNAQQRHYHATYPTASFDIILCDNVPAGRLYVNRGAETIGVIDIALLPEFRGRGIGTTLLREVLAEATPTRPVFIHVEKFNPARRLYDRLGFRPIGDDDVYVKMEWRPMKD